MDNLVDGLYSKDGNTYQFQTGVIVSIAVCPACYTETYYTDCSEGAGTISFYVKSGTYFYESTNCANYDPTNPDSIPTGVVNGNIVYGSDYPTRTKYEFFMGMRTTIGACPPITTTTVPPECCHAYGYEPTPLSEWGSNYSVVTVYCPSPIDDYKNCYQYVTPTTTTTSTTTTVTPTTTTTTTTTTTVHPTTTIAP